MKTGYHYEDEFAFGLELLLDDAVMAQAQQAGATLTGGPHERAWGLYSGYFRDPDGHLWEILWNPDSTRPQA